MLIARSARSLVLARPLFGLFCVALAATGPVLVPGPRGTWIMMAGLLVCGLADWLWRERRLPRLTGPLGLAVLPLLGYAAVTIVWSPDADDALHRIVAIGALFFGTMILVNLVSGYDGPTLRALGTAITAAVLLGTATLAIEVFFDHPIYRWIHGIDRPEIVPDAKLNRPLVLYTALIWPAALHLLRQGCPWAAAALMAAMAVIVQASTSQSALLGLAVGLIALAGAWMAPLWARRGIIGVVALAVFAIVPIAHALHAVGGVESEMLPYTARHRVEIWHFAAERVAGRPIFGHGLAASRVMENLGAQSRFLGAEQSIIPLHPHNAFLQVWLELGLIGALAAFVFALWLARQIARLPEPAGRFAMGQFMAVMAMLSVAYGAWQEWLVAGLLAAALATMVAARAPEPAST